MSKLDEKKDLYKAEASKIGLDVSPELLDAVTKSLGPLIYNEDSSRVSCSDAQEMARVKNNFLIGKLGMADGPELDAALKEVCEQMGSSNRNKYRAIFYALLIKKFGKESMYQ
ncbi:MAG: DUF2853 family protein [Bacteroidota bacterium]